jgi:uncharacterized membrane protein YbaN (DUF454 family)
MTPRVRKVVDWIVGLSLLAIGVVGLVLPILQGWMFILAGLAVLSSHSPMAKRAMDGLRSAGRSLKAKLERREKR